MCIFPPNTSKSCQVGYRGSAFCDVSGSLRMASICPESRLENVLALPGPRQGLVIVEERCKDNLCLLTTVAMTRATPPSPCLPCRRPCLVCCVFNSSPWADRLLASGSQLTRVQLSWGHTGAHELLSQTESNKCYLALEKPLLTEVDFLSDSVMSLRWEYNFFLQIQFFF